MDSSTEKVININVLPDDDLKELIKEGKVYDLRLITNVKSRGQMYITLIPEIVRLSGINIDKKVKVCYKEKEIIIHNC